jgi:salicylate hydroxylase
MVRRFINQFPRLTQKRRHSDFLLGIKSIVRPAVLGRQDVRLQPNSTAYQCTIPASIMKSNQLTAPLVGDRGLQSWWGPNSHFICGQEGNSDGTYNATFFIHPTKDRPLTGSDSDDASASNSQNSDRRGDINDILANVSAYEPKVKAFTRMIKPEDCLLWKVAVLPDLPKWVSGSGRVVLLGDAAHAMSPHLGQVQTPPSLPYHNQKVDYLQGAAVCIEDGGVLAECIGRAETVDDIPAAVRAYENIQKPRAEKVKREAEVSGDWKTLTEGPRQRRRDEGFEARLAGGPKYEFWRASGHLAWIYGWNYKQEVGISCNFSL